MGKRLHLLASLAAVKARLENWSAGYMTASRTEISDKWNQYQKLQRETTARCHRDGVPGTFVV